MKKYFINYTNNGFLNSQKEALDSATKFGFNVKGYNYNDIDSNFKNCEFLE